MKNLILIILTISLSFNIYGQDFDTYQPLKPQAPISKDILTSSTEKYNRIKDSFVSKNNSYNKSPIRAI